MLILVSTSVLKAQELELYQLRNLEINEPDRKVGFISLSDNYYPLSNHPDSSVIPDLQYMEKEEQLYFRLDSIYRKRFLSNISETDKVFVYDYSTDILRSFPVKKLNVVARLNDYMSIDECFPDPCSAYDYMIGFEICNKLLKGVDYLNTLVYVGKENPFVRGQMKAIVWEKIASSDFPMELANDSIVSELRSNTGIVKGEAFLYESENFNYFVQNWADTYYDGASHKMYK